MILEPPAGTSGVTLLGAGLPLPGGAGLGGTSCPTCGDYREFLCSRLRPPRCQSRVGWGGACGGTPPWRRRCGAGCCYGNRVTPVTPYAMCHTSHAPSRVTSRVSHPLTPGHTRHTRSRVTCTPPHTCHTRHRSHSQHTCHILSHVPHPSHVTPSRVLPDTPRHRCHTLSNIRRVTPCHVTHPSHVSHLSRVTPVTYVTPHHA